MDIGGQLHLSSPSLSMDCPFKTGIEKFFPLTKPWRNKGTYTLIESEQQYKDAVSGKGQVVCHFSEKNSYFCSMMDLFLSQISFQPQGTHFLNISAEENPGLVAKLHILDIPTLALIRDGEVTHRVVKDDILDDELGACFLLRKILAGYGYIRVAPSSEQYDSEEEFDDFNC